MKVITSAMLLCVFTATAFAGSSVIKASDYGEEWPFTVSEGLLKCTQNEVTFVSDGVAYAVNGTAASRGFAAIEPIWLYDEETISEIAKVFEITVEEAKKESPLRINIGTVLDDGLALCDS